MEYNNITTYETQMEFSEKLAELVGEFMESVYDYKAYAEYRKVMKTNVELDGITVKFDDSTVAPTIYTEEMYQDYLSGAKIEDIAKSVCQAAIKAHSVAPELPELTPEEAKKHITLNLVNTERNQELLSKVPHFEICDLSAIPRWWISDQASFVVNNEMCSRLMLTPEEVLQIGQTNINSQTYDIRSMQEVMKELMSGDGMDPSMVDAVFPPEPDPQMIVMTTQSKIQGSCAILSKEALDEVREKFHGSDYIILPSSLSEVICVKAEGMDPAELRNIVHEVNSTQVQPQDYLSDNIMKYDGKKLAMVMDGIKMDTPKLDETKVRYAAMRM